MLKLHQVLKSSRAAIDLASIMVGIIVIGLIGSVIAATVFAVIPWAQNNAAKQQLDSVVSAESSYRGLSADKDTNLQNAASSPTSQSDPNQVVLNSTFTGSAGLAKNNLLTLNTNGLYCVIATADGKDYHAYSKSGSGQWFYATSGKTQPSEYTGTGTPCITAANPVNDAAGNSQTPGSVNTVVDNGSTSVGTVPTTTPGNGSGTTPTTPTPDPVVLGQYSFEDGSKTGWTANESGVTITVSNSTSTGVVHSGVYSIYVSKSGTDAAFAGASFNPSLVNPAITFQPGKNYTVDAWVYKGGAGQSNTQMTVGGTSSGIATIGGWSKLSVTFTATNATANTLSFATLTRSGSINSDFFRVDDITITQNN
jgi:hypothetical protein